jgi:hypothetical protein
VQVTSNQVEFSKVDEEGVDPDAVENHREVSPDLDGLAIDENGDVHVRNPFSPLRFASP